jgi:hypothetical protein
MFENRVLRRNLDLKREIIGGLRKLLREELHKA